jgi:hypothetical protein
MDPNLFHLDWERVGEVLATVVVLAFVLERALAVVFESKFFLKAFEGKGLKELIAAAVAVWVCARWNFDAISMIVLTDRTSFLGELITGMVVAGGSKASLKLFHDVLDVRSSAHEAVHPPDATGKPSPLVDAAALAKL